MKTYRIKPLEWKFRKGSASEVWSASAPGFYVEVRRYRKGLEANGKWEGWYKIVDGEGRITNCDSPDHGKSLAQSDWIKRIEPALEEVTP